MRSGWPAKQDKVSEEWGIWLAVYAAGAKAEPVLEKSTIRFGESIELRSAYAQVARAAADGLLPVQLVWRANAKIDRPYKIFVHVGAPGAEPISQMDSEPVAGYRPTTTWDVEDITDRRGERIEPIVRRVCHFCGHVRCTNQPAIAVFVMKHT